MASSRIDWVDYAKGLCIILVVMMHAVHNYQDRVGAVGWLSLVVDFARPFRMPDFFLISGLFLSRTINAPLRDYVDKKVVHFAYFYLLWLAIQMGVTQSATLLNDTPEFIANYAKALFDPINTLWFVHMLLVFYVVTRMLRRLPAVWVFAAAVGLQIAYQAGLIETGWSVADRFASRYVYFFAGYAGASMIFGFADRVARNTVPAMVMLLVWGVANGLLVGSQLHVVPVVSLAMGFAGAAAVVSAAVLLAKVRWAALIGYTGANSIVVYLSFFFPMIVLMKLLSTTGVVSDIGTATLIVTAGAVVVPLIFHALIRRTPLNMIYDRPAFARLSAA